MDLRRKSLTELKELLERGDVSSESIVLSCLEQIKKWDSKVNAFITLNERAVEEAKEVDKLFKQKGSKGGSKEKYKTRLRGLPLAFKDMFCTKNLRTTAGSKMLETFQSPYSATVVERLFEAGVLNLGKTNQDEFAMGTTNEFSYWGQCRNPWNFDYVPGGSSGGSAAAVAAGMIPAAIGTDTGGSVRLPASFCGVVGVKPTYGRVSRYGIIAFASSLDQAGTLTRNVEDATLLLEIMCGKDPMDSTTSNESVPPWRDLLKEDLKGLKVGIPKEYLEKDLSQEAREAVEKARKAACDAGAKEVDISLPLTKFAIPSYYFIATSEASSNLARYDGIRYGYRSSYNKEGRSEESKSEEDHDKMDLIHFYSKNRSEGFGKEVKRRILLGTYVLSAGYYDEYYKKACKVRRLIRDDFLKAFKVCDVMITPVSYGTAFLISSDSSPLSNYLKDFFTVSSNLAGLPSMSLPAELSSSSGLPLGVQLIAPPFKEETMFNFGFALEKRLKFKGKSKCL